MAFDQIKYQAEFDKKNYDKFNIRLPKEKKEELKDYAKCNDISLNDLIKKAITEYTGIDLKGKKK